MREDRASSKKSLEIIYTYGTHRQMGQQIGEAFPEKIVHSIENAKKLLSDAYDDLQLNWEGARIQAKKYIPFAEERYPQYVDEMRGMADGAKVPFDDIALVNAIEAVTTDALHLTKCTSMAVNQEQTANGHVLIAHNEDWIPEDEPDVYLVHAKPNDEPAFIAMTYGALLPNIGFNEAGIAQCCDSVYTDDSRIGIPRTVVSRAVLASRIPGEAIRHMLVPKRAAGYNHLLVHESGELYNIEVSARRFAVLSNEKGYLVHTNHYLDPNMQQIESEPDELIATRVRYWRSLRLLSQTNTHTIKSLQSIQKDHVNYPDSICNHDVVGGALDREKTITALTIDLTTRQLYACHGNPCENPFSTYQLNGM